MPEITRAHGNGRMSQIVTHGDTIYLAGQVGTAGASVTQQTQDILDKIDALLAEAGTDKTKILQAIIWLDDMADFAEMNAVWDAWVPQGNEPVRAAGSAHLATPEYKVEIIITAAK
ncbi:RidA family protein [Neptunicoccus sediminis]|uniref:RidA family protein n=1 Tax=Neptunicoccus sediminis TaxID=1892596 RepID=UPI000845C606|nr:RidA family protein [Neptunicoccus sediminis]